MFYFCLRGALAPQNNSEQYTEQVELSKELAAKLEAVMPKSIIYDYCNFIGADLAKEK